MNTVTQYNDFFSIRNLAFLTDRVGVDIYDYDFRNDFSCRSVIDTVSYPVILRIGAIVDYDAICQGLADIGMRLAGIQGGAGKGQQVRELVSVDIWTDTVYKIIWSVAGDR